MAEDRKPPVSRREGGDFEVFDHLNNHASGLL
jgi:hypothetical protein